MDTLDRAPPDRLNENSEGPRRGTELDAAAREFFEAFQQAPYRLGFFSALRRLDCLFRDRPRTGEAARPRDEAVRIGQEPTLTFPPATLASFSRHPRRDAWWLRTYFFGLFGANGPLPIHLTEYAYERARTHSDQTLAQFADIFHHRMAECFYRAWASAQPTVHFDRPESDRFAAYIGSFAGLGMPAFRHRDAMPDLAKFAFSGYLAATPRHADGLLAMIRTFFQVPVKLVEFVGDWIQLPPECRLRLGKSPETGTLGLTATVGGRIWDRQQTFRLELGPLSFAVYGRLLPGGASLARLVALVRNYLGDELNWELRLILEKREVPPLLLGQSGQLGWTSWLAQRDRREDARDLTFQPVRHPLPAP